MRQATRWLIAGAVSAGAVIGGCGPAAKTREPDVEAAPGPKKAAPEYNAVAAKYNERVELLGGRITIDSRPAAGTSVHVTIPAGDGA